MLAPVADQVLAHAACRLLDFDHHALAILHVLPRNPLLLSDTLAAILSRQFPQISPSMMASHPPLLRHAPRSLVVRTGIDLLESAALSGNVASLTLCWKILQGSDLCCTETAWLLVDMGLIGNHLEILDALVTLGSLDFTHWRWQLAWIYGFKFGSTVACLEWGLKHGTLELPPADRVVCGAIERGHLQAVVWAIDHANVNKQQLLASPETSNALIRATADQHLPVLDWWWAECRKSSPDTWPLASADDYALMVNCAFATGSVEMVEWWWQKHPRSMGGDGPVWFGSSRAIQAAMQSNSVAVVQWLWGTWHAHRSAFACDWPTALASGGFPHCAGPVELAVVQWWAGKIARNAMDLPAEQKPQLEWTLQQTETCLSTAPASLTVLDWLWDQEQNQMTAPVKVRVQWSWSPYRFAVSSRRVSALDWVWEHRDWLPNLDTADGVYPLCGMCSQPREDDYVDGTDMRVAMMQWWNEHYPLTADDLGSIGHAIVSRNVSMPLFSWWLVTVRGEVSAEEAPSVLSKGLVVATSPAVLDALAALAEDLGVDLSTVEGVANVDWWRACLSASLSLSP
ncbi:hypothetical protein BC828DRAFT_386757 [Blastocladiella britannica]|nr:hypothetical protein BC828DRAFT_386757 [Blastocladiella britannica]